MTACYYLLTGSTGLLGRYLLRDLLREGKRVAVLARPTKHETACQRVEAVMGHWESVAGYGLARPIVLEGDICRPGLGLDSASFEWVAAHCRAVVHSAASMTFREDKRGEPEKTNVQGMRRVLEFCRASGIREFHHISTAYVCGLREGRVRESELDLGQLLGNVYEKSKLEAEKLLRAADFLDVVTVYRPASLVGDSQTGYTSNYHGFYVLLQLACAMADKVPPEEMGQRFFRRLRLDGSERKNFVPVDWVSAAIAHLLNRPEHHGRTYHLASPEGVSVRLMQEVVQEAMRCCFKQPVATQASEADLAAYEKLFEEHMLVYRSHWRNDPVFDCTESGPALTHLPCPCLSRARLLGLARFAIEHKFHPPRHALPPGDGEVIEHLERIGRTDARLPRAGAEQPPVTLEVSGRGGGQWQLALRDGQLVGAERGVEQRDMDTFCLAADTLASLARGQFTVEQSLCTGRVLIRREQRPARELTGILRQLVLAIRALE